MKMKKITIVFVGLCLLLQIFAPGLIFPVKIARAGTLSTGMFPSSLAGIPLYQTSTQIGSPCYSQAQEFVSAIYVNQAGTAQLGASFAKFSSASVAKSTAYNCLDMIKQQYGSQATFHPTKETTVFGYDSLLTMVDIPSENVYMGTLYTIVQDYLIALVIAKTSSVSESTLKSANATLVTKLSVEPPPPPPPPPSECTVTDKEDGQPCVKDCNCESGNCQHERCCVKGEECCWNHPECPSGEYCDQEAMYCMTKKENGQECRNHFYCKSDHCSEVRSVGTDDWICCAEATWPSLCCRSNDDCGNLRYCKDNACTERKDKGASCSNNDECLTEFCYQGSCDDKPAGTKLKEGQSCSRDVDCQTGICDSGPNTGGKKYCCRWGQECCQTHSDCRSGQFCKLDYGQCSDIREVGRRCTGDYACKSGYCKNGWCKIKEEKPIGSDCWENDECKSAHCISSICCRPGEYCCENKNDCFNALGDWWNCQNNYCVEDAAGRQAFARGRDDECEGTEPCDTLDCMATARCVIKEACEWGNPEVRAAAGCIAAIASDLNIVAKVASIIENIGCGIIVKFINGILEQNVEKVVQALANIVWTAIDIVKLKVGTIAKFVFNILVCIDNYVGLSPWFVLEVIPAIMGVISSVAQEAASAVGLGSPASLMITDEKGRQVGIDEQGNLRQDIPGGFYVEFPRADIKMVILTDTKGKDFDVETRGTEQGQIDLTVTRANKEGEIESIEYNDVSQDRGAKTELSFKSKVGADVPNMDVTDAQGQKRVKEADEVIKDKIEVPDEFKIGGFFRKLKELATSKAFLFIVLAFAVILILAGVYISFKRKS